MKYAKKNARTRHRKVRMKIMYNAGKEEALAKFVLCFFLSFQFSVTKMKLLSNFATLRYVFFSVLFSLRACAIRERVLELNLKLYYFCCCYCLSNSDSDSPSQSSHFEVGEVIAIRFTALIWLCLCNYHNFLCNCKLTF